ncbi:uncharacterized protein LOC144165347 [Haemaphysalis longicornis]
MAYAGCKASIIVNKNLSESINVGCSVRQGCPLSPLLFALYLEPFCLKIIKHERIRGFALQNTEVKLLAYADDIAVFCRDQKSISEAVKVVKSFCEKSGAAINWDKCSGLWHGNWCSTPAVFECIQWTTAPTKYLGVPLDHYRDSRDYWTNETEKLRDKTRNWQGRNFSMFARATICNLFLLAKVWYVLQVLCMSRANVQKIHRVFAVFIWSSSWERTSRSNIFRPVKKGGLGLCHLFLRQVVARFCFVRDQKDAFLRTVIQVRLKNVLPDFVVSSSDIVCRGVKGYLREVALSVQFLKVRFSFDYLCNVSRKRLYKDLVDVCLPVPLYRSLYGEGTGLDVLRRVKSMPVKPAMKSFFFKLHSETLPVDTWLAERGIFVPWTTDCRLCKKPETINHVFIDCWDPVFHWDVLQRTLKKDLPITPRGIRFLPVKNEGGVPYDLIMLLSLHSIWKTRMAVRNADINSRPVRENFIESVQYIREVFRAEDDPPEWLPVLDDLVCLRKF